MVVLTLASTASEGREKSRQDRCHVLI
jgi:hypothetical protein